MEITCTRCHQIVQDENRFCPVCGLPQLVYAAESSAEQVQAGEWNQNLRDAGTVNWKAALRVALLCAVPAGLLSSLASPLGGLGLIWISSAAIWAVVFYMRTQRPAWITIGAGARIGLVTGLLATWLAFGASGIDLFVKRYALPQSTQMDAEWKSYVDANEAKAQEFMVGAMPDHTAQISANRAQQTAWMLTSEGHAAFEVSSLIFWSFIWVFFAIAGGALGARMLARSRRPEF